MVPAKGAAAPALLDELANAISGRVPGVADPQQAARSVAPGTRAARELLAWLREEPMALRTASSDVPLAAVRLAHVLHEQGRPVTLPACADCGQPRPRLSQRAGSGRVCPPCARRRKRPGCGACGTPTTSGGDDGPLCRTCQARGKPPEACGGCGQARRIKRRLPDGTGLCQNCHRSPGEPCASCGDTAPAYQRRDDGSALCRRCYRPPEHPCARCGQSRPVHARTSDGPVCDRCHSRPQHQCGRCGQVTGLRTRPRDGQPGICDSCYQPPVVACAVCGGVRPGARSTAHDGAWACASCRAKAGGRPCDLCGKTRPVTANWPIGSVCATCYQRARRQAATCPGCGQRHPLIGLSDRGERTCSSCAGLDADFACRRCGSSGLTPIGGLCWDCLAADRVASLLSPTGTAAAPATQALGPALLSAGTGEAVWQWLAPGKPARVIVDRVIATGQPASHALLDEMPQAPALHRLRAVLMHAGALPARADHLERIVPWLEQLLASHPATRAHLIRTWAHWTTLRRARSRLARRPFTEGAAHHLRTKITAALALLAWTDDTGRTLASLTQADIDTWLTHGATRHVAYQASDFLRWARRAGLAGQAAIPPRQPSSALAILSEDERWTHLRRCLTDTTLPDDARCAGALVLLYGLTLSKVTQLGTSDVITRDDHTYLALSTHQLRVAPPVARLLHAQAAHAIARGGRWLFPGAQPGQHASSAMRGKLRQHGLPATSSARAAALISLASELPAAVLAELLGITIQTAEHWADHTRYDWAHYLAARTSAGPQ